jgi:hypothetical protein
MKVCGRGSKPALGGGTACGLSICPCADLVNRGERNIRTFWASTTRLQLGGECAASCHYLKS